MLNNLIKEIELEINNMKKKDLFRSLDKEIRGHSSSHVDINGENLLNFCSNNYLGLTTHPEVISFCIKSIEKYGTGSGASRLISGNLSPHVLLEHELADFLNSESALIFPTGYQANIGIISSFVKKGDAVFCDRLCHASIIDGVLLSQAKLFRYPHKNITALKELLSNNRKSFKHGLIITESVFSMDGDIAPLKEIANLAKEFNCFLLIDEAHAIGILGKKGCGAHELHDIKPDNSILIMGTFGKAFGCAGAFVACRKELKEYMINKARSFIFTTAPLPVASACALKSLEIIRKLPQIRENLITNARMFREKLTLKGFNCMESETQIIPVLIGDNKKTMLFSKSLFEQGIYIQGIRPPTVPPKTARLRISLMATHTQSEIERCIESISKTGKQLGII